jgi:hypothetical protein
MVKNHIKLSYRPFKTPSVGFSEKSLNTRHIKRRWRTGTLCRDDIFVILWSHCQNGLSKKNEVKKFCKLVVQTWYKRPHIPLSIFLQFSFSTPLLDTQREERLKLRRVWTQFQRQQKCFLNLCLF